MIMVPIPRELVQAADQNIITMQDAIDLTLSIHSGVEGEVHPALEAFLLWELEPQSKLIH